MVALHTGLRRGDLIRLTRARIKNGWIVTDIEKTNGSAEIPIHSDLAAELAKKMPAASLMLVPTARGRQMNKDSLSHGIQKECNQLGIVPNPSLHGLRRNAIISLLEAGCSREEVMEITDQSKRMVEYYAGKRHKRALAASAILKLEKRTKVSKGESR
jgi:integrase